MQLWHGTTDTTLSYVNFGEEIKQWTNVLGVSQTPSSTDTPVAGWTRTRYANSAGTATISPGGSTTLGMQGTWASSDAAPASFTVNATPCT